MHIVFMKSNAKALFIYLCMDVVFMRINASPQLVMLVQSCAPDISLSWIVCMYARNVCVCIVYVCIYVFIHVRMHACIVGACIHTCMYSCMYVCDIYL